VLFSIIVPVYNIEKWLSGCIESIVKQTCREYELILVDDGSTDRSGQICDQYKVKYPDRILVIHKQNGGLSDARNAGVQQATGGYLLFVDGDDYIAADALENLRQSITRFHADIVLSEGLIHVDEQGKQDLRKKLNVGNVQGISGEQVMISTASNGPNWSACGKAFRLEFWRQHGFQFPKGRTWEDFQVIDKVVLAAQQVSAVPAFYYYQYRSDSIVHTVKASDIEGLLLSLKEWEEYLEKKAFTEEVCRAVRSLHAIIYVQTVLGYADLVEKDARKKLVSEASHYRYLLSYGTTKQVKLVRYLVKCIGFTNVCALLAKVKGIRYQRNAV
jgi:glycosyltransferase involved in cell wall biosynthesis